MIGLPDATDLDVTDEEWELACTAATGRMVDDPVLLDVQRKLSQADRWDGVYVLSVMAGLETSVLIDADDQIFLDWGTAGQVTLQPPVGARIPFKLWVHTHPRFAAYWSGTDTGSLSLGAAILRKPWCSASQEPSTVPTNPLLTLSKQNIWQMKGLCLSGPMRPLFRGVNGMLTTTSPWRWKHDGTPACRRR